MLRVVTVTRSLPPLLPHSLSCSPRRAPFSLSNPSPRRRKPSPLARSAPEPAPPAAEYDLGPAPESEVSVEDGFEIEVRRPEERRKNRRVIRSRVRVDAALEAVWGVLTDYEGLSDFIPSLAVSRLVEKGDKFARLYQVGQQELALGFKFDARGVLDCYERDLEYVPFGRRRNIDFKMIEGDFHLFEGTWSIEQIDNSECKEKAVDREFQTTLSYVVELEPKLWLPVSLLEGRLCKEVRNNILCVREEAQRIQKLGDTLTTTWKIEEDDPDMII